MERLELVMKAEQLAHETLSANAALGDDGYKGMQKIKDDDKRIRLLAKIFLEESAEDLED